MVELFRADDCKDLPNFSLYPSTISYKETLPLDFRCLVKIIFVVPPKCSDLPSTAIARDSAEDFLNPPPRCPIPYPSHLVHVIYPPFKQRIAKQSKGFWRCLGLLHQSRDKTSQSVKLASVPSRSL